MKQYIIICILSPSLRLSALTADTKQHPIVTNDKISTTAQLAHKYLHRCKSSGGEMDDQT